MDTAFVITEHMHISFLSIVQASHGLQVMICELQFASYGLQVIKSSLMFLTSLLKQTS